MKKSLIISFALLIGAFGIWSFSKSEVAVEPVLENAIEVEWLTIEEAMERQQVEPKHWLIDVYTDWCGWCKRMDATTFKDPYVMNELNKNFYAVKFDGEAKRDITIGEQTFKFVAEGRRGYHELAAQLLGGKMSYPSIAYMSDDNKLIQMIPGYKSAQDIHPILQYFGTGTYKTTSWEDFQKTYASPYPSE